MFMLSCTAVQAVTILVAPNSAPAPVAAPASLLAPSVSGVAAPEQILTADDGLWAGDALTLSHQWLRDGIAISGATTPAFAVGLVDAGAALSVVVTASNSAGEASAVSAAVIAPPLFDFSDADWTLTPGEVRGVIVVTLTQLPGPAGAVIAVDYAVDGGTAIRAEGPPTLIEISGLPDDVAVAVQVRPVTAIGPQAWSVSKTVTPFASSVPDQMAAPTLTAGDSAATLTLASAPGDGGATITTYGYEVASFATGNFASPIARGTVAAADRATPIDLSPLVAGSYSARSRAINATGPGPWSAASTAVTVTAPSYEMLTVTDGVSVFTRAGGFVAGDARYSMNWATGVMTITAGAATTFIDIAFYTQFGVDPLTVGETVEIDAALNVSASGTFGVGIRGVGTTVVYSTAGQSPTIPTGAQTYAGTVVVPDERITTYNGHAIVLRVGSTFAGTVDINALARLVIPTAASPEPNDSIMVWISTPSSQDWVWLSDAGTTPFGVYQSPWNMTEAPSGATLVTTLAKTDSEPFTLNTTVDAGAGATNGRPLGAPMVVLGWHFNEVSPINPFVHGANLRGLPTDSINQCLVSVREAETGGGEYFTATQSCMFRGPLQTTDYSLDGGSRAAGEILYDVQVRHYDTWSGTTSLDGAIDVTVGGVAYKYIPSELTAKARGNLFLRMTESHTPTDVDMTEIFRLVRDHWNAEDGEVDDFYVQQIATWIEPIKGVIDYTLRGFRVALNGVAYGAVSGDVLPGTTYPTFALPPSLLLQSGGGGAGSILSVTGGTWDDGSPAAPAYPDGRWWRWYLDGVQIVPPAFGYDASAVDVANRANGASLRVSSALAVAGGTITARAVKANIYGSYDRRATGAIAVAAVAPGEDLPGEGTLNLGKEVSHVQIAPAAGVTDVAPGYARAGFQEGTTGAHVYRVTTLSDGTGAGTLRHAVTSGTANNNSGDPTDGLVLTGPRIVAFDVAGVINLGSELGISRPKTYIAGHTAPGHVVLRGQSIKCRVSDVVARHITIIPDLPSSKTESQNSGGFGVVKFTGSATDNIKIERVWLDHYMIAAWADQGPYTFTNARNETNDISFTNGIVVEGYRAPNLNSPWQNFHEANHNLGPFIGERSLRCTVAGNIVAGCAYRTPQVKLATQTAVMGNFIHDFQPRGYDYQPAPVQVSSTDDVGDVSLFPIGKTVRLAVAGNYAEPGQLTRAGGSTISGGFVERLASTDPARRVYCYHGPNRIDPTVAGAVTNPDGKVLGPNGEAVTPSTTTGHIVLTTPEVWSEYEPTHPGDTRAWTLAHAGPRPNEPNAIMTRLLTKIAAQAAKSFSGSAREKLYRDTAGNPTDAFNSAGPTVWSVPANPFSVAANGLTNIENALNALSDALGGTPWGNIGRPLTTTHGGRLVVERQGMLMWTAAGAHPNIVLNVTFTDGETRAVTIGAAG